MNNTQFIQKRICIKIIALTGKQCGARAVKENTLRKGTKIFLNPNFCQMHQPDTESKRKCVCPMCDYHVRRRSTSGGESSTSGGKANTDEIDDSLMDEDETNPNAFGLKRNKNKPALK